MKLDGGGADRVMADVRSWARRNPGGFLLGAAVTGFVAGRVARNFASNDGSSNAPSTTTSNASANPPYPGVAGPTGMGAIE